MRLENYITEKSDISASDMELAIVQAWDKKRMKYSRLKEYAKNIVEFLKANGVSGKAEHIGSGYFPVSETWKKYGGTDSVPKTDILIGKYKISVKKSGRSQLMSGKKGESRATFYSIIEKMNGAGINELIVEMESYFNNFIEKGVSSMNISQQRKSGIHPEEVVAAEEAHSKFTKRLTEIFEYNTEFRNNVVHEAISGEIKFGGNIGTANYLLVFGNKNKWEKIDDMNFISNIASRTTVNVSYKSKTKRGKYNYFSVVRLISENIEDNRELLLEGKVTDVIQKVLSYFYKLWSKVKEFLKSSVENIFEFLLVEPELSIKDVSF
ncbi:MAG: hypothetical protein ACOC56_06030 [Atribacterota bacterium]